MILLKIAQPAVHRRRRDGLGGVAVALGVLAMAPAALASGWSIKSPLNPPGATSSALNGVSCTSHTFCIAVGSSFAPRQAPLVEQWNGSTWSFKTLPLPGGARSGELEGVSCTSGSFCEAVGDYSDGTGKLQALAYGFDGSVWKPESALTANPGASLYEVSCTSGSFCQAVGSQAAGFQMLTEQWNGTNWAASSPGGIFGASVDFLHGVSCTSPSACVAVGQDVSSGSIHTLFGLWNGSRWTAELGLPGTGTGSQLQGVSCTAPNACHAVGFFFKSVQLTLAEFYNGSSFGLRTTPSPGFSHSLLNAVSCTGPSFCWAVGSFDDSHGINNTLGEFYNGGSGWQNASLPTPTTASGFALNAVLNGVSCPTTSFCEAVGSQKNTAGKLVTLSEQYSATITPPPFPPPFPKHFALTVHGLERHGATITAVLHKPRQLVLLVQTRHERHLATVGVVRLGNYPKGRSRIHWNLRVNGQLLRQSRYEISLRAITDDVLSPATPPGEITLTVTPNGHMHVGKRALALTRSRH